MKKKTLKEKIGEEIEELEATGQDNETEAIKWVREKAAKDEVLEKEQDALQWEKLWNKRRTVASYRDGLLEYMKLLKDKFQDDIPPGYQWWIIPNDKGIMLSVREPSGKWYGRGTKVCGEPKYDMNAVERLVFRALEFMDKAVQQQEKQKGQIVV